LIFVLLAVGKLYDSDVVDACLGLLNSGKFEFKAV
jgi:hypothetical protein